MRRSSGGRWSSWCGQAGRLLSWQMSSSLRLSRSTSGSPKPIAMGAASDGLTTPEREELNRLRRENRQLKVEREILSKAAAWFARETNAIPAKGSGS